jgi:hypothetical protein
MHDLIYEKLKETAKERRLVTYGELAPLAGLDMDNPAHRTEIGRLLGEISTVEHRQGCPMLSAVAVLADSQMPGKGFFTLAKELVFSTRDDVAFLPKPPNRLNDRWAA